MNLDLDEKGNKSLKIPVRAATNHLTG